MSRNMELAFLVVVLAFQGSLADPRYLFGLNNGDMEVGEAFKVIDLPIPVYYYGNTFTEVSIFQGGIVEIGLNDVVFPVPVTDSFPAAVKVFYRVVTDDAAFLAEITADVQVFDPSFTNADQVAVITWIDLPNDVNPGETNNFQLAIVSGGAMSYFIFNYYILEFGNGGTTFLTLEDGTDAVVPFTYSVDLSEQSNVEEDGRMIIKTLALPAECIIESANRIPCSDPLLGSEVCEEVGCCFEQTADLNATRRCYKPTECLCTCVKTPNFCDLKIQTDCMLTAGEPCGLGKTDFIWNCFPNGNRSEAIILVDNKAICCERCVGGPIIRPSVCSCGDVTPHCNN